MIAPAIAMMTTKSVCIIASHGNVPNPKNEELYCMIVIATPVSSKPMLPVFAIMGAIMAAPRIEPSSATVPFTFFRIEVPMIAFVTRPTITPALMM